MMTTTDSRRQEKAPDAARKMNPRCVQIGSRDTRREDLSEECRRESLIVNGTAHERAMAEWLAAMADTEGWE